MTSVSGFPDFIPMMRSLERDDFSSNRHPALSFCLSMIFFGKPVPTFPDHALAPPTDLEIELVMLGLPGRRRRGPFRKFAFALFNEGRKLDRPVIRNFDVWRGASNAYG